MLLDVLSIKYAPGKKKNLGVTMVTMVTGCGWADCGIYSIKPTQKNQ
jgi:hypothetical protein